MTLKEREKEHILHVLNKTHWDLEKTAHVLRIPRSECWQKLKEYGLENPEGHHVSNASTSSEGTGVPARHDDENKYVP